MKKATKKRVSLYIEPEQWEKIKKCFDAYGIKRGKYGAFFIDAGYERAGLMMERHFNRIRAERQANAR